MPVTAAMGALCAALCAAAYFAGVFDVLGLSACASCSNWIPVDPVNAALI